MKYKCAKISILTDCKAFNARKRDSDFPTAFALDVVHQSFEAE